MQEARGVLSEVSLHMQPELFEDPTWRALLYSAAHNSRTRLTLGPWISSESIQPNSEDHTLPGTSRIEQKKYRNEIYQLVHIQIFPVHKVHITRNGSTPTINEGLSRVQH